MTYPDTPGYARDSDTSREAAEKLTGKEFLHRHIVNFLTSKGTHGATVDETKELLEEKTRREYDRSTIAARFTELEAAGRIVRTEATRKSARGRRASVYCGITPGGAMGMGLKSLARHKQKQNDAVERLARHLLKMVRENNSAGWGTIRLAPLDVSTIERMAREAGMQ